MNSSGVEATVEVKDLTVRFGDFTAVNGISFGVRRGEIFGFLGANGAGKTTTIRVLCGLLTPTSGQVLIAGVRLEDGELAIKAKVGYMSQKFTLYDDLKVDENLDFIAALRKLDRATYLKRRKALFDFISFEHSMKTLVHDLPGGVKQQVALAAALLHDPEIIFLDEPTAGVFPVARARFWSLIRKLSKQGKTVFVTTHYMDEAEQCDRIALMRDGVIISLDTPDGLKSSTFPMPVFEFDPKEPLSFSAVSELSQHEVFSFFEPYGLRFHASIRAYDEWAKVAPFFATRFHIRKIKPSLEDVFIRAVEAKNQ
ncbi:ABC transporter ATP-binding protein [Bdellovibrionota bacterium FG-1]